MRSAMVQRVGFSEKRQRRRSVERRLTTGRERLLRKMELVYMLRDRALGLAERDDMLPVNPINAYCLRVIQYRSPGGRATVIHV